MKELFLNRRFFMFLWGGVFALLLTFVFPRVYPWVIWALGCGGGLVVVDITLLYGFGKACGAQRIVGDKFSNGKKIRYGSGWKTSILLRSGCVS